MAGKAQISKQHPLLALEIALISSSLLRCPIIDISAKC